ncbi:hypothetical protein EIN_082850, partial [Entamoeba invadens IP1]|uniref:hypothetical protein n=1 Tax=Entamoeba invadens IP1 TaxID=370355 RepID=UPI0002C3FB5D
MKQTLLTLIKEYFSGTSVPNSRYSLDMENVKLSNLKSISKFIIGDKSTILRVYGTESITFDQPTIYLQIEESALKGITDVSTTNSINKKFEEMFVTFVTGSLNLQEVIINNAEIELEVISDHDILYTLKVTADLISIHFEKEKPTLTINNLIAYFKQGNTVFTKFLIIEDHTVSTLPNQPDFKISNFLNYVVSLISGTPYQGPPIQIEMGQVTLFLPFNLISEMGGFIKRFPSFFKQDNTILTHEERSPSPINIQESTDDDSKAYSSTLSFFYKVGKLYAGLVEGVFPSQLGVETEADKLQCDDKKNAFGVQNVRTPNIEVTKTKLNLIIGDSEGVHISCIVNIASISLFNKKLTIDSVKFMFKDMVVLSINKDNLESIFGTLYDNAENEFTITTNGCIDVTIDVDILEQFLKFSQELYNTINAVFDVFETLTQSDETKKNEDQSGGDTPSDGSMKKIIKFDFEKMHLKMKSKGSEFNADITYTNRSSLIYICIAPEMEFRLNCDEMDITISQHVSVIHAINIVLDGMSEEITKRDKHYGIFKCGEKQQFRDNSGVEEIPNVSNFFPVIDTNQMQTFTKIITNAKRYFRIGVESIELNFDLNTVHIIRNV